MDKKLFVELFRFNHKTDYLPYYRKYNLSYNQDTKIIDLLEEINSIETFNFEGIEIYGLKVNNLFVNSDDSVARLVEKSCNSFIIEPASTYRAVNDLKINNNDFLDKLDILNNYLTQEQKNNYINTLQNIYYSSNTLTVNKNYIGDHVLIAAFDIIEQNPKLKNEILQLISNEDNGIWYHTSLINRVNTLDTDLENKIKQLLQEVTELEDSQKFEAVVDTQNVSQGFNDFNIALYAKSNYNDAKEVIKTSQAKYIDIASKNIDLALHSLNKNNTFSYKLAGQVLLDAKDNNADFIVVNDKNAFELFDAHQPKIEKAVGREINMPIVTLEQMAKLINGERDAKTLGFDNHKVNVSFL